MSDLRSPGAPSPSGRNGLIADSDKASFLDESRVFCMLPWASLNFQPDGKVLPCCFAEPGSVVGDLRKRPLTEIWNSEELRRMRLNMLNGIESPQCAKCYAVEKVNFHSVRKDMNRSFAHHFASVLSTKDDGTVAEVNLPYLDIRFSNLCNFACRYCNHTLSTTWFKEDLRIGRQRPEPRLRTPLSSIDELWGQLEPHLEDLEMLYFTGGEPLLMPEHYRLLKHLHDQKAFHVYLQYSTNFSVTRYKGLDVMEIWKDFSRVYVGASLDAAGRRGEYIRKNQIWDQVVCNRERLSKVCPNVTFVITPTLTIFNALHLPDFHWDWLRKGYVKPDDIYVNFLFNPPELSAQVLPAGLKRIMAEKYWAHLDRVEREFGPGSGRLREHFRAALEFVSARDASGLLEKFREETVRHDSSRGEKFVDVFPELAEIMKGA